MNNCKEEDKKFVSQAVAYVIKHSHKGIVPLCASLATLLQEQDRLQKQLKALQESNRKQKKSKHVRTTSPQSLQQTSSTSENPLPSEVNCAMEIMHNTVTHLVRQAEVSTQDSQNTMMEKYNGFSCSVTRPISGCFCRQCSSSHKLGLQCLVPPLKVGDFIIIKGELCGAVKYIGHIDFSSDPYVIFVGIQLDEAIGDNNGMVFGKQYFICPSNCGLFVTLDDVLCVVK